MYAGAQGERIICPAHFARPLPGQHAVHVEIQEIPARFRTDLVIKGANTAGEVGGDYERTGLAVGDNARARGILSLINDVRLDEPLRVSRGCPGKVREIPRFKRIGVGNRNKIGGQIHVALHHQGQGIAG